MMKTKALTLCVTVVVLAVGGAVQATGVNFEGLALGVSVDGQAGWTTKDQWGNDGWGNVGPAFDEAVVDDGTGNTVWRASNAVTIGGLSAQPFSQVAGAVAGETGADLWNNYGPLHTAPVNNPPIAGAPATTKNFYGAFDFWSATGGAQPGLVMTVSPAAKQVDSRMSYIKLTDDGANGFDIGFYETGHTGDIWGSSTVEIASNLPYNQPHRIEIFLEFVDGLQTVGADQYGNDIVKVYVDGTLAHTGSSWETYYKGADPYGTGGLHGVDSLTFNLRGTAVPSVLGNGFFVDNVEVSNASADADTGAIPEPMTMLAVGMAVAGLGGYIRKRRTA